MTPGWGGWVAPFHVTRFQVDLQKSQKILDVCRYGDSLFLREAYKLGAEKKRTHIKVVGGPGTDDSATSTSARGITGVEENFLDE